jgi:hypothetical protein
MNPNDIPADKLDNLRTYYINTKAGFIGKESTDEKLQFVMEAYKSLTFDKAEAAVKFANNLVESMGIPLTRVFYCSNQQQHHGIALLRRDGEKIKYMYIGQSDTPMQLQGGLPALLNRIKQSRR